MLIGIDASRAVTAQRTGTETYSYQLIRHLLALESGHRYRLYFNAPPPPGELSGPGVEHCVIPFPRLWTHARLSWEMVRRPPDLLYVPAHVLPLIHPRHTVVTVHDVGHRYYPEAYTPSARLYLELSTHYNARAATRVIADSQATRRDILRFYRIPAEKVIVVYPGCGQEFRPVRDAEAQRRAQSRYDLPKNYILYLGTIQPRKNLERLLEAYRWLREQLGSDSPHLVIAGKKGWLSEPILRRVGELGLDEWALFPGYVAQEDLPALLSGALCFVMPSLYEGFGLPVLEAMACGTPVVCANAGSLPEVAGDAALLVDPLDSAELAGALRRVLSDEDLRQELVARGLAQAARFTWDRCAREVLAVLESR